MPTLPIEQDLELYYEDDNFTDPWRSAPAMLLQHGFSRHAGFWYNWVPLLGREFRILRPDMRGMGCSTMPAERYEPSLLTFASDVRRLLDHLGIDRVVFVGESFGGIIGQQFAHAYPERTRALVLCNTPCRLPHGELRQRFSAGGDWDAALGQGVGTWSSATIDMRLDTRVAPEGLKAWYIVPSRDGPHRSRMCLADVNCLDDYRATARAPELDVGAAYGVVSCAGRARSSTPSCILQRYSHHSSWPSCTSRLSAPSS